MREIHNAPLRARARECSAPRRARSRGRRSRTEAVGGRAEAQVAIHLQRCDRDVRPVKKVEDVDKEEERQSRRLTRRIVARARSVSSRSIPTPEEAGIAVAEDIAPLLLRERIIQSPPSSVSLINAAIAAPDGVASRSSASTTPTLSEIDRFWLTFHLPTSSVMEISFRRLRPPSFRRSQQVRRSLPTEGPAFLHVRASTLLRVIAPRQGHQQIEGLRARGLPHSSR